MRKPEFKKIGLVAYRVNDNNKNPSKLRFHKILSNSLIKTPNIEDRFMLLSKQDEDKEGDTILYYDETDDYLFGIIIRTKEATIMKISESQLKEKVLTPEHLKSISDDNSQVVNTFIYFCVKDDIVIFHSRFGSKIFQTYVNWLTSLDKSNKILYKVNPIVDNNDIKLSDIKDIAIQEDFFSENEESTTNIETVTKTLDNIKYDALKNIIDDVGKLDDININELLEIKVYLKFILSKDKKIKERIKQLKTLLKSGFSDHIKVTTKNNTVIRGNTFFKRKTVSVNCLKKTLLSEESVKQEMLLFIDEVETEINNEMAV